MIEHPDLVYILGRGSKWRNNELRFSLRSVEKYLPHRNIWIVGERPKWLRNIEHIHATDAYDNKLTNAAFKIRAACRVDEISEKFVLMNDDFFFLRHTPRIETYTLGPIRNAIADHSTQGGYYFNALRWTRDILTIAGHNDPVNYEVHYPMLLDRKRFLEATDAIDWIGTAYLFRSIYGNAILGGVGVRREDTKLYTIKELSDLAKGDMLSSSDRVVLRPEFQKFIYEKFPDPSRYEDPASDPGKLP